MVSKNNAFSINMDAPFNGYVPKYFESSEFGDDSQAYKMESIRIDSASISQDYAIDATLETTETIHSFARNNPTDTTRYKFAVSNSYVYTIDAAGPVAIEEAHSFSSSYDSRGENDCVVYKDALYYFFTKSGGSSGEIGKATDITAEAGGITYDDAWGSGEDALLEGGDNICAKVTIKDFILFSNSQYLGKYDGTTLDVQFFDFGLGNTVGCIEEQNGIVYVVVTDKGGKSTIHMYNESMELDSDGNLSEYGSINVGDIVSSLISINGIVYLFHHSFDNDFFSYINGSIISETGIEISDLRLRPTKKMLNYDGVSLFVENKTISTPISSKAFILSENLTTDYTFNDGGYAIYSDNLEASYVFYSVSTTSDSYIVIKKRNTGHTVNTTWTSKTWHLNGVKNKGRIDNMFIRTSPSYGATAKTLKVEFYRNKENNPIRTEEFSFIYSSTTRTYISRTQLGINNVDEFYIKLIWDTTDNGRLKLLNLKINGEYYSTN